MQDTYQRIHFIHSLSQKKALLKSRAKGLVMNPQITYHLTSINHTLLSILYSLDSLHLKGTTWVSDKYTPKKIPYRLE